MDADLNEKILNLFPYVRYFHLLDGYSETYHVPWRMLYDYEIIYMLDGELTVTEVDNEYTLHAFDFHIMPPGIKHKKRIRRGKTCRYYDIHCDMFKTSGKNIDVEEVYIKPCELKIEEVNFIEELAKNRTVSDSLNFPRKLNISDPKIVYLFEKLGQSYLKNDTFSQLELRGLLLQILAMFFSGLVNISSSHENLDRAITKFILLTNDHEKVTNIMSDVGFNKQYFRKLFKEKLDISPKRYMIMEKIENAKRLLRSSDKNINEISSEIGYDNPYYFSRLFKKYVGVSPKKFREKQ